MLVVALHNGHERCEHNGRAAEEHGGGGALGYREFGFRAGARSLGSRAEPQRCQDECRTNRESHVPSRSGEGRRLSAMRWLSATLDGP